MSSSKRIRTDPETFFRLPHLAQIDLTLAIDDLRHHALRAYLGKVALLQAMLLYQELEHVCAGDLRLLPPQTQPAPITTAASGNASLLTLGE